MFTAILAGILTDSVCLLCWCLLHFGLCFQGNRIEVCTSVFQALQCGITGISVGQHKLKRRIKQFITA